MNILNVMSRAWLTLFACTAALFVLVAYGTFVAQAQEVPVEETTEEVVVEETTTTEDEGETSADESAFIFSSDDTTTDETVTEKEPVVEEEVSAQEPAEEPAPEEPESTEELAAEEVSTEESAEEPVTTEEPAPTEPVEETSAEETPAEEPTTTEEPATSPELSTDKDDYNPGELVTIFGRFFTPMKHFIVRIFGNSEVGNFWSDEEYEVIADDAGEFTLEHQLDNFYRPTYDVTATDEDGDIVAEMTFLDAPKASIDVFDQCANDDGDGYNGDPGECNWTNGNMNQNNSSIFEEDGNVQRLLISGLIDGPHVVTLEYQTTKGGKHAYDFLTDYDLTEDWVTKADLCSGTVTTGFASCLTEPMTFSPNIPSDPLNTNGTDDTNQNIGIINGTITNISTPTLVSGSYAADSLTQINVTFDVDTSTCADAEAVQGQDTCPVFMTWAAHVSSQEDWGEGQSAVNISGSPYHMKVVALDGASTGNRDNQMQADAILVPVVELGNIVVVKETLPDGDPTLFTFNPSWTTSFQLSDGQSEESEPLEVGTYSVTETVPDGWVLDNVSCVGSEGAEDPAALDLGSGETITCTFTNGLLPTLELQKTVINDNGGSATEADFQARIDGGNVAWDTAYEQTPGSYTASEVQNVSGYTAGDWGGNCAADGSVALAYGDTAVCTITNDDQQAYITVVKEVINDNGGSALPDDFNLTLEGNGVTSGVAVPVDPGTYTADETLLSGYSFLGFSDDCDVNGDTTVALGESKTCTLTNDDQQAYITVVKEVNNNHGGTAVADDFNLTLDGDAVSSGVAVAVDPGTYGAGETLLDGYEFDGFSGDCDASGDTTVALGESKTCMLTNSDLSGTLIVNKVTDPASDTTTEFTITASPDGSGDVESPAPEQTIVGGGQVVYTVSAGTYDVTEAPLAGWVETGNTCDDVVVPLGGEGECTITNTQNGHIIIEKNAISDSDQAFTFQNDFGNGNPASFDLTDDSTPGLPFYDAEVTPGTYNVSEDSVDGWQLENIVCDDNDSTENVGNRSAEIIVSPGETVTCTFTNEELASITLVKETIGGDDTFDFDMTGDGLPASDSLTTVDGSSSETYEDLDQDNAYSFAEVNIPAGWVNTSATCDNGDPVDNVTPNPGEDITCTFVNNLPDAQIDVTPANAFNAVNDPHEIVATVQVHDGDGSWGPAPDNTLVTFTLENNNNSADFVGGVDTCLTTAGSCSVFINTTDTGSVEIHAEASPEVLGINIDVETDGTGENSENANKTYVNARIGIESTATNEVDDAHIFTVTVEEDTGSGWTPIDGVNPVVTFSPSDPGSITDNCDSTGTDVAGECTVEINSAVAGIFEADASVSVSVEGINFDLATDGTGENSGSATKTYVDASISLSPQNADNEVGDEHVITATVMEDPGTGMVAAVGETVTFTITSGTATFVGDDFCVTDGSGQCSVTINDTDAGFNEIDASVSVSVGGLTLDRATDADAGPGGSDEAEKTYVDARISIGDSATNNVNDPHTFTIHVEENDGSGWVDAEGETVDTQLLLNTAGASYVADSSCVTDADGECTVTINSATPGTVDIHAESIVGVASLFLERETDGNAGNSGDATKTYVAGQIRVEKVTVGGDGVFEFNPSWASSFNLSDGEGETSGYLPLISGYSVSENVPDGWDLTDVTCDNGDDPSSITLDSDGELVTCVFTNTKRAKVTIIKNADPNDLADFDFNINGGNFNDDFILDDDEGVYDEFGTAGEHSSTQAYEGSTGLIAGQYIVTEALPNEFWTHEGVTCTNDGDQTDYLGAAPTELGVVLDLEPGDEVTCVFLNTKESPTRTQGFWQTHYDYTSTVFEGPMGGSLSIGDEVVKTIDFTADLFGAFWSNISNKWKLGKGKPQKRAKDDKARMQLLQQLVAAELNCAAFGCADSVREMLDEAHAAFTSGDVGDIIYHTGEVDAFNNSGDTLLVENPGKANPKAVKEEILTGDSEGVNGYEYWNDPAGNPF